MSITNLIHIMFFYAPKKIREYMYLEVQKAFKTFIDMLLGALQMNL